MVVDILLSVHAVTLIACPCRRSVVEIAEIQFVALHSANFFAHTRGSLCFVITSDPTHHTLRTRPLHNFVRMHFIYCPSTFLSIVCFLHFSDGATVFGLLTSSPAIAFVFGVSSFNCISTVARKIALSLVIISHTHTHTHSRSANVCCVLVLEK